MTEYGPCSTRCGDGKRANTTIFCKLQPFECDRTTTFEGCNLGDCPRKYYQVHIIKAAVKTLILSNIVNVTVYLVTGATRWQKWSPWSQCFLKDGRKADCWKDHNDPPQATRTQVCTKETSNTEEVCNRETRNCRALPICTFGETFIFMKQLFIMKSP